MLEAGVIEVDENHTGSAHDPHNVLWGTVAATIVYGLCGYAGAYGAWSVIAWAAVEAVGGSIFFYYYMRDVTNSELRTHRLGISRDLHVSQLPPVQVMVRLQRR